MNISALIDKVWVMIMVIGGVLFYTLMISTIIAAFIDEGLNAESLKVFFGFSAIIILSFTYLIMVYIGRTKKDIEILEIMAQQHQRTEEYLEHIHFLENAGPMGQGLIYLDHGGFFLLPFVQRRKNYKDIDVKKIPFKKKLPFILVLIFLYSVPVLGIIAWWI